MVAELILSPLCLSWQCFLTGHIPVIIIKTTTYVLTLCCISEIMHLTIIRRAAIFRNSGRAKDKLQILFPEFLFYIHIASVHLTYVSTFPPLEDRWSFWNISWKLKTPIDSFFQFFLGWKLWVVNFSTKFKGRLMNDWLNDISASLQRWRLICLSLRLNYNP